MPLDVRRQWHFAEFEQQFFQRLGGLEMQSEETFVTTQHDRMTAISQLDPPALLRLLADAELHNGLVCPCNPLDQDLHRAAGALAPIQACRQHAGVVEYQQVARAQEFGQLTKQSILQLLLSHIEQQHSAGRSLR